MSDPRTVRLSTDSAVHLSAEDRELLKQILLAVKSLKPEEAPKRLQEPAEDLGSKSDYGLAS